VPGRSVWLRILGVVDSVLESLVEEPDGGVVAHVRPKLRQQRRCGICGRRGPVYDQGEGRRRWRGLDVGYTRFLVEAAAPRVTCRQHGVPGVNAKGVAIWSYLKYVELRHVCCTDLDDLHRQLLDGRLEVILDAKLAADHLSHPPRGPDLAAEAERLSALGQQQRQCRTVASLLAAAARRAAVATRANPGQPLAPPPCRYRLHMLGQL
jgi:hypothetical protein